MYASQQKYRQTRYGCTPKSKQPPDLSKVINALRKQSQQRLGIPSGKNNLRAILARASHEYAERGPADELIRFLLNTDILIEESEDGKLHYDGERADDVLACCDAVREPEPSDPEERLRALRGEDPRVEDEGDVVSEVAAPEEEPLLAEAPPESECLSFEELELLTRPESVVEVVIPALVASGPPSADYVSCEEAQLAVTLDAGPVVATHILYLTAVEALLWERIGKTAKKVSTGSWRLAIPATPELLHERWFGSGSDHSEDAYDQALQRFVDYSVLAEIGATSGDQKTFALSIDPAACRVIPIVSREEQLVTHECLDAIRAIQQGRERASSYPEFAEKFGVVVVEDGREIVCRKGFERHVFVTAKTKIVSPPMRTPRPPRVAATPSRKSKPALALVPKRLQDETDARLAVLRDEHLKTIARAQAMIEQSKGSIDAIDAELVRRAQAAERLKEEKRAVLQRQLVELQRQLAELDNPS